MNYENLHNFNYEEINNIFKKSIIRLVNKKGTHLTVEEIGWEVINNACLYILQPREKHKELNQFEILYAHGVIEAFILAGCELSAKYAEYEAKMATLHINNNLAWSGMWAYLCKYFLEKHSLTIDNTQNKLIAFQSSYHKRYEYGILRANTPADRVITALFEDNENSILVSISPTLSEKTATLVYRQGNIRIFENKSMDYRFTVINNNLGNIDKFVLEMPSRFLAIEYFS